MKLQVPSEAQVIELNKYVCEAEGNTHHLRDYDRVSSALHTAFYPGSYPYTQGGVAKIAGALL